MTDVKYCPEHGICQEKLNTTIRELEELKKERERINIRIDSVERSVNTIDKTLGERMNTLEITYKLGNEQTNNKIDKLDRKVDKLIEKGDNQITIKSNRIYELIKSTGLVIFGIIIAYIFKRAGLY
jgi:predicted  nucleic acid-binding Zn-ribbon protein